MIAVIGGGAAGIMAAISARLRGAEVVLIEKNSRLGKKILATGNGRCNFTNTWLEPENFHGENPSFALGPLHRFTGEDTLAFFRQLGVIPKVEADGRVFPHSDQAGSILDLLRWELAELGVQLRTDAEVVAIDADKNFSIHFKEGASLTVESLILATGGAAHPQLGSDGAGFRLAKELGHSLVEPRPALVQLQLGGSFPNLNGIKAQGELVLLAKGEAVAQRVGELHFASYGLSGLPALALSRKAGELMARNEEVFVAINLAPEQSPKELEDLIIERCLLKPKKPLERLFVGWLPKKIGEALLKTAKLSPKTPLSQLSSKQQKKLSILLTAWQFPVVGLLGWERAQVTAGGVRSTELNPATLESKLVPKLYFAGEIIDIDGDSGGFNLQWAFSSGFVAGEAAAGSLRRG